MKRMHIHVGVNDLDESVRFYSSLFGSGPSVLKADYAKWMLDEPRVNFAISLRSHGIGLRHLGIQVETVQELDALRTVFTALDPSAVAQTNASCCYARSNKSWATDPTGIVWEAFHTTGTAPEYGDDSVRDDARGSDQAAPHAVEPDVRCCSVQAESTNRLNSELLGEPCCIPPPADLPTGGQASCC